MFSWSAVRCSTLHFLTLVYENNFLARSANLPEGLYIFLALISFFFMIFLMITQRTIISGSAGPIFAVFHRMKAFWVQMIDLDLFFRYLKGRCHGNQFCGKNGKLPSFVVLAFRNGMGYRYLNVLINSINDASILCKNFVNFSPIIDRVYL